MKPPPRTSALVATATFVAALAVACTDDGSGRDATSPTAPWRSSTTVVDAAAVGAEPAVRGTAYRDLDADGARDAGEPGVPGVVVALAGTPATVTSSADGTWELALPPGRHVVSALTGWLPSACPGDLHCAAGRAPDQDFAVENQFLRAEVDIEPGADPVVLDLGLLPDHGDPAGGDVDGNDPGDGPAAAVDLAVRHSAAGVGFAECPDGPSRRRVCPVGARFTTNLQLYNQGTEPVRGVELALTVPDGVELVGGPDANPSTPGPDLVAGAIGDGVRRYTLPGAVEPAAARWFRLQWRVTAPPRDADDGPFAVHARAGVAAMSPTDEDGAVTGDPAATADRGHNVNWPAGTDDDTSDAIGWNVG